MNRLSPSPGVRTRPLLAVLVLLVLPLLVLAGPAAPADYPQTWLRAIAALTLLGWFPGWILLQWTSAPRQGDDLFRHLAGPMAVSPIVSTGLIIAVGLAGGSMRMAALSPVLFGAILWCAWLVRERHGGAGTRPRSEQPDRDAVDRPIHLFLLGTILLLVIINLANPWLRWRADGRFHIGVVAEILRGGLPPTDPFFAGLNLQYMWFFHGWLAGLSTLTGASTSWLMVATNGLGLVAFLGLIVTLARDLGRGRAGVWITMIVAGFGMGGLSWALLPLKLIGVFTGARRGMEELSFLFRLWPTSIQNSLGFLSAGYDQPFLLRKFLVGTAMSLGLAAFMLLLVLALRRLKGEGARLLPLLSVATAGAIVLHPMIGIPAVAALVAAVLPAPWIGRFLQPNRTPVLPTGAAADPMTVPVPTTMPGPTTMSLPTWGGSLSVIVAALLGVAMSMPYLTLVMGGKEGDGGLPIDFYWPKVLCLTLGSLGLTIPILIAVRRRHGLPARRFDEVWLVAWGVALAGFAMFVRFPLERGSIDKPSILMHLAVAFVAGGVLGRWWDDGTALIRRRLVLFLLLLVVPTHVVMLGTYWLETDPRTYRVHEREAHAWIRDHAPLTAIVFDSLDRDRPGVEIPRRMYWSHEQFATTHQYPVEEMDRRRALRNTLYDSARATDTGAPSDTGLRAIPDPVFVIVRAGEARPGAIGEPSGQGPTIGSFAAGDVDPLDRDASFARVFDSDDTRVYRLLK